MDQRQRHIILKNKEILTTSCIAESLLPCLIQDLVVTLDDAERVMVEATRNDKAKSLLNIIQAHPNGYSSFLKALSDAKHEFLVELLERTEVDEEDLKKIKDRVDKEITDTLKDLFCYSEKPSQWLLLENVEEEVRLVFLRKKEPYNIHMDHLQNLVSMCFPKCIPFKRKKAKVWAIKGIKRMQPIEENIPMLVIPDYSVAKKATEPEVNQVLVNAPSKGLQRKKLRDLNEKELADVLKPQLSDYGVPENVIETIVEDEIDGKGFCRLELKHMVDMFPDIKKGKRFNLHLLKEDMMKKEESVATGEEGVLEEEVLTLGDQFFSSRKNIGFSHSQTGGQYKERFRKFDREASQSDTYRRGALLTTFNNKPGNLLDPVHVFSMLDSNQENITYQILSDEVVNFMAACLNSRTNGTIHVGVKPKVTDIQIEGEVCGMEVDVYHCLRQLYKRMYERFYREQLGIVTQCMRPQFVDVISKDDPDAHLRVLEVDVVPSATLVLDEAFFTKSENDGKPVLYMFGENGVKPHAISDEKTITFMSKDKFRFAEARRTQENRPKVTEVKPDLRQKMLDLLSAGDEHLSADVYSLLFLSPLDSKTSNDTEMTDLEFLVDLDPNAVFDFDYSTESKGLYGYFDEDKEQVMKALTSDNFDPQSEENQFKKDTYNNLLEDITLSVLKPWIFCNGYEAMSKTPMTIMEWKQNRSRGLKEALRFYNKEIPEGRALVMFFLMSKDFDILLEAAEEAILSFKDQWIVFAESEDIFSHFFDVLVNQRHTVNKEQLKARSIIGMPWIHVNQTIKDLMGSKRASRCEIPSSTGAFIHLKDKRRNELIDLEILSRCECEDPDLVQDKVKLAKIRREEAERFYKGENVSWWNFYFPDHVLKRDIHGTLKNKVEETLKGLHSDEDNKIGVVNVFHQPGAGATTTAKHILWELKSSYRCCIVKQMTDQTVEQITILRNYEESDDPKPPLVLIENGDEEKVGELFAVLQHRARIVARRSSDMKVFCVLLLCTRRSTIRSVDDKSVALKHELSRKELAWFQNKNKDLETQFRNKELTDPRFLISFNILKENFNTDYIRRTAVELVKGVTDENERKILKYLSMLNTFDLDFQSIPISAFDPLMTTSRKEQGISFGLVSYGRRKVLNKSWEQSISQPLQVLLNRNNRAGLGSQLVGLSIVNPLFAAEIFSCFIQDTITVSVIMKEFLESQIFNSFNISTNEVKKVVRTIMKKREEKEENAGKVKFSPLIMKLLEDENEEIAANVLIKGFEMTEDPMICQQIARLYIHGKNWKLAAKYANIATNMKPQNSFLWDTYAQVFKNQLYDMYICFLQESKQASTEDVENAIEIAQFGLQKFRREQEVSEMEQFTRGNDAGYYGEIRLIILLLDVLRFSPLGRNKIMLHTYLTDRTKPLPKEMASLRCESVEFLKDLESRSEVTLKAIEDKSTQLKDDTYFTMFSQGVSMRKEIAKLKENLDSYFGEDSDLIPENLSEEEKTDFRRRRVRRLGGRSLSEFIHIDNPVNLSTMLNMLIDNVNTEYCQAIDIITLFNITVAMKVLKIPQDRLFYQDMVHLSKRCYEKAIASPEKRYLEAYMYFVLLNWPTESRTKDGKHLCTAEQLQEVTKKWKLSFLKCHPRQKDSRPIRKRETTNFYLGKESDMGVHYEELLDHWGKKVVRGDKIWESPNFVSKLLRLPGTLVKDGNEIICNVESRSGGQVPFYIPTSFPIGNRSWWQKRVYFVLGFTWAGLKAYDVRDQIPEVSKNLMYVVGQSGSVEKSRKQTNGKSKSNPKRVVETHESFVKKVEILKGEIKRLDKEKNSRGVGKEKFTYLEREQSKYQKDLEKLLSERKNFYET